MPDEKRRPSGLNDEELRKARLRVSDPYEQDGLVWKIPPGVGLVDIDNTYAFERWPEEKVRCIKCDGHRHKHGFTAALSDGSKVLLGSKCGEDEFKVSWSQARNRHRERAKRQTLLFRLDALLQHIPEIIAGLRRWHEPCIKVSASRRRFASSMAPLYAALRDAARREGGQLRVHKKVRDLVAEANASEDDKEPKWTWVNPSVGTMQGVRYFGDADPEQEVSDAIRVLDEIRDAAANTGKLPTAVMASYNRRLQHAIERLELVAGMYADMLAFYAAAHLRRIAGWATETTRVEGTYRARGEELYWKEADAVMTLPPRCLPLNDNALVLLREAVEQRPAA